ncbi:MAG: AbrB/MazE/SpoVT family DNA-binding domain-containing protein [Sphingobacteriia bacterium]|nr:AbrB/MazE/SpoVT family DNA-binding domain-containing protein [Sphingobacteriia bacterium]
MQIHFSKWGNSIAVRIPKSVAEELGLNDGTIGNLKLNANKSLVIEKINDRKSLLNKLLNDITPDNLHNEISSGYSIGAENID